MSDEPKPDHVKSIYDALLGRPVLLFIPKGKKRPVFEGWNHTTYEGTQDPDYQEQLRTGNVGVMLGSASVFRDVSGVYHLCSIDLDEDEEVEPFLAANPRLRGSLITKGRRGGNIWLWVLADSYPPMAKLTFTDGRLGENGKPAGWGEWRSESPPATEGGAGRRFQTVIYGAHPDGMQYRRVSAGLHPIRLDFSEIVWTETVDVPWRKSAYDELVDTHGEPWFKSKKGALTVNPPFFVAKYAMEHDVIYEPEEERFYDYDVPRGLWVEDSGDSIRWKFSTDFKKVADDADESGILLKRTNSFLQGLVQLLKGCGEKRQAFKREAGIVHLLNGMLDVRQNPPTLAGFAKEYYSRNQLAVELSEGADCPRFKKELLSDAVNVDDVRLLQRWAGQLLLGVNLTQKIMLLTGQAGRGKSTFINVMARIIGESNVAGLRTDQLHQRFELFNYVGKTFLVGADVPGHFLMTEGSHVLKALVGKDVLTAEKKNGDSMNIVGDFNVGLTSNSRLKVRLDGDTDAWRRRLMIVNYELPAPSTPDPQFLEKLLASEASGILNWMIEGAMVLLAEVAEHGKMVMTDKQKDRVDSLLAESDSIKQFVRQGLASSDHFSTVTTQEMVTAYVHYCEERGWNPLPTRKVESALPDAMLEIHRLSRRNDVQRAEKNQRGYYGIRILDTGNRNEEGNDA